MAELKKKWYVVRAVSGQENKIKGYIESEVERHGFSDYLEDVLVPTEKVIQIRNGKKINITVVISTKGHKKAFRVPSFLNF